MYIYIYIYIHMYMSGDEQDAALDYDAVQRGDAEMENRMNRVIRACIDLGERNPIVSIHDQGAGGEPKSLVPHIHIFKICSYIRVEIE